MPRETHTMRVSLGRSRDQPEGGVVGACVVGLTLSPLVCDASSELAGAAGAVAAGAAAAGAAAAGAAASGAAVVVSFGPHAAISSVAKSTANTVFTCFMVKSPWLSNNFP